MAVLLMKEMRTNAFDLIVEITKQVITLSTVLIALGITFIKDFAATTSECARTLLVISWIPFLLSIIFGLLTLMACVGILGRAETNEDIDPYRPNLRVLGGLQLLVFLSGLVITIVAGFMSV